MQRCVYVNTVRSYVLLFQKYFFKRSQVLKYLQKNIYPKLITFPCIFRMFIFSLTILKCSVSKVWGFFYIKICVNSMLTALSSPLGLKALSLVPTQQQWPRLSAFINQLHHQNMVFKKTKKILELKSYREQKRSLNFLSFISKKVKNYPRFLGISTINFFPNKCLKKRQRKPL